MCSVHDIIQNYQYKYTKVLSNIKKHSTATKKMRDLVSKLKKARLHEILEADLSKATKELQELAATSSKTSEDEGSYASLKDRAALIKADLEKMGNKKINKVNKTSRVCFVRGSCPLVYMCACRFVGLVCLEMGELHIVCVSVFVSEWKMLCGGTRGRC